MCRNEAFTLDAQQLTDFERTPLKTYYLQADGEPLYHLVNEPFDYSKIKA